MYDRENASVRELNKEIHECLLLLEKYKAARWALEGSFWGWIQDCLIKATLARGAKTKTKLKAADLALFNKVPTWFKAVEVRRARYRMGRMAKREG